MYNMYNNNDNNNKCQKFPEETFKGDFNKQFLKINLLLWKKALLHTDGSEMTFVAGATKVNLKNLKT